MPDHLQVLLVDKAADVAALLERQLARSGEIAVHRVPPGGALADAAAAARPDAIILVLAKPDAGVLDDLHRIGAGALYPVVLFVGCDDRAFMEEAIGAGATGYHVVGSILPEVNPIVMAALATFRRYRRLADDLRQAKTALAERDTINRAKSLLMRERNLDEPQAYRWLRRRAMNESRRIADIAAVLIDQAEPD